MSFNLLSFQERQKNSNNRGLLIVPEDVFKWQKKWAFNSIIGSKRRLLFEGGDYWRRKIICHSISNTELKFIFGTSSISLALLYDIAHSILGILSFRVLEYCKASWTLNGRWRYINVCLLFIYLFSRMNSFMLMLLFESGFYCCVENFDWFYF